MSVVVTHWRLEEQWELTTSSSGAWESKMKAMASESGDASEEWLLSDCETPHAPEHMFSVSCLFQNSEATEPSFHHSVVTSTPVA